VEDVGDLGELVNSGSGLDLFKMLGGPEMIDLTIPGWTWTTLLTYVTTLWSSPPAGTDCRKGFSDIRVTVFLGSSLGRPTFSSPISTPFVALGDRRLTSSRPGDNEDDVELAFALTDSLEESKELLPEVSVIIGTGTLPDASLRLSLMVFLLILEVGLVGGGGAGRMGIRLLTTSSSRRARSLAAAVARSTVLTLAKGVATEASESTMTGFDIPC
jgi:hypothetical protein